MAIYEVPDVIMAALRDAFLAAKAYRAAEQDGTPRLWRGKDLHDLAMQLDTALERLQALDEAYSGDDA